MTIHFRAWLSFIALLFAVACEAKPKVSTEKEPAPSAAVLAASAAVGPTSKPDAKPSGPLVIAFSDWPGWIAWDIAVEKGYFREAGVDVTLTWLEYTPSMEAFSAGKADAVCMTNGDALVSGSSGAQSVGILINDFSNGNDMIVAQRGLKSVADLKGKKIAVEVGFVDHLLLLEALKSVGLSESDVNIVNEKTHKTPDLLASGAVQAIAAWQPNSGQALERVAGSSPIFTSANAPGLIYDLLFVSPESLKKRRADWKKVVSVWFRVASYIQDPKTRDDAIRIMAARVKLSPEKYGRLIDGTFILNAADNRKHFAKSAGLDSVYGSSEAVDKFNVANHIYKDVSSIEALLDPSLVSEVLDGK